MRVMSLRSLAIAAVCAGAMAIAPSAMAAAPSGIYAPFKYCPYTNTAVQSCLVSNSTSGSFKLGNATVPALIGYGVFSIGRAIYYVTRL